MHLLVHLLVHESVQELGRALHRQAWRLPQTPLPIISLVTTLAFLVQEPMLVEEEVVEEVVPLQPLLHWRRSELNNKSSEIEKRD